jgi:hypothetical protein
MTFSTVIFDVDRDEIELDVTDIGTTDAVRVFMEGYCYPMAWALHRLTGWPIYVLPLISDWYDCEVIHAVVESPEGYADVLGPGAKERWEQKFYAEQCTPFPIEVKDIEANWHISDLEMTLPFARAVLDRYFPDPTQLLLPFGGPENFSS